MGAKMIVDAGIDGGAGQAEQGEKGVELFIPFPRGLFEAVKGLTKTTDEMFFTGQIVLHRARRSPRVVGRRASRRDHRKGRRS